MQYCVGFCHISTGVSHRYTYILSFLNVPPPHTPSHPSRMLQSSDLSSLSNTANSHWLRILYVVAYMFPCYSLHSSHPLLPPWTRVHKPVLYVCLCCCPADRFISTIFLDSIYTHTDIKNIYIYIYMHMC